MLHDDVVFGIPLELSIPSHACAYNCLSYHFSAFNLSYAGVVCRKSYTRC